MVIWRMGAITREFRAIIVSCEHLLVSLAHLLVNFTDLLVSLVHLLVNFAEFNPIIMKRCKALLSG
ncbi:hypothetical protein RCO48_21460 [Peribacillus frigoritolerans]|nr:hypothetical protein [Peribacillus frigoritolerans]